MKEFSQAVCEKLGYYVYILKDPKDSKVFYVGKGKGNRIFQHIWASLDSPDESDKLDLIRKIKAENVQHFILRHGLTELQALEIESACIDLLGLPNLTNKNKGYDSWASGLKTVEEVIQHHDARAIEITEKILIININRLYERFMSEEKLYEATRASWVLGQKREKVDYVIASYRGLVREVYKVNAWKPNGERWEFEGEIAEKEVRDKYLNQSLDNYIKKGSQNPVRYAF